ELNLISKIYEIDSNPLVAHIEGILMGIHNNNRKNKSGIIFENLCEKQIMPLCKKYNIECYTQLQFDKLESMGISIPKSLSNKKADFILIKENNILNIEVN
ncbi:MAG: hypothetical protein IJH34_11450, partial [Romboutsia sp.]|nr:hypothetical protein [Romboutsia sp.]